MEATEVVDSGRGGGQLDDSVLRKSALTHLVCIAHPRFAAV